MLVLPWTRQLEKLRTSLRCIIQGRHRSLKRHPFNGSVRWPCILSCKLCKRVTIPPFYMCSLCLIFFTQQFFWYNSKFVNNMISYIQEFRVENAGLCKLHFINELSDVTDLNLVTGLNMAQNEEANNMLTIIGKNPS